MSRGESLERVIEVFKILLDGRSHTFDHFIGVREEFSVIDKTIRRDLDVLCNRLGVRTFKRDGQTCWIYDHNVSVRDPNIVDRKRCPKCCKGNRTLPASEFRLYSRSSDRLFYMCLKCEHRLQKLYRDTHQDEIRERRRISYLRHQSKRLAEHRQYYKDNSVRLRDANREYYKRNREKILTKAKDRYQKLKRDMGVVVGVDMGLDIGV